MIIQSYSLMKKRKNRISRITEETYNTEAQTFDESLYKKFSSFMTKQKSAFFNRRLNEYFGKNFAVNYKDSYNFKQQWENEAAKVANDSETDNIWKVNSLGAFVLFMIMLTYVIGIWSRNIECFFADNQRKSWMQEVNILLLILQIPDGYLKFLILSTSKGKYFNYQKLFKRILSNIYCFFYLILAISNINSLNFSGWWIFQAILLIFLYLRARKIYASFRLTAFGLNYQNLLKTFDMAITLLITTHAIAVILYQVTKLGFQETWFSNLTLQNNNQLTRYIYSFYFGTSTIFTVGYGDISPKNQAEVCVLIIVQSVGIVIMGYIINQIGYSLSAVRKNRQELQKELILMNKMKKYYKIDDQLIDRARSYIINEKPSIDYLPPQEQTRLLTRFNEELRNEIKYDSSLSVVKSCIFFLCRWSKSLQNSAASKLNSIMFAPSQHIYQPEGKERIYIIKAGKIEIYTKKKGYKKGNRHILKTIINDFNKEVSDNSYGYTAVISSRPVRLCAVASQSTSAYYIDKQKFLQSINERVTDFQYFHEVKDRIDLSKQSQALQVPQLQNSKHHYNPTRTQLIRKYNRMLGMGKCLRKQFHRQSKKTKFKMHIQEFQDYAKIISRLTEKNIDDSLSLIGQENELQESQVPQTQLKAQTLDKSKTLLLTQALKQKGTLQYFNTLEFNINKRQFLTNLAQKISTSDLKQYLTIDLGKQYTNYFPSSNRQHVLNNMELNQYMRGNVAISNIVTTDMSVLASKYFYSSNFNQPIFKRGLSKNINQSNTIKNNSS